jgi:hypothetical protein
MRRLITANPIRTRIGGRKVEHPYSEMRLAHRRKPDRSQPNQLLGNSGADPNMPGVAILMAAIRHLPGGICSAEYHAGQTETVGETIVMPLAVRRRIRMSAGQEIRILAMSWAWQPVTH